MNPIKTQQPAVEPITVLQAKSHLRVDIADDDLYIESLIPVVRLEAENRLQRTLIQSAWRVTMSGFPQRIELPMPPVIAVTALEYQDEAGVWQTLNAADYVVDIVSLPAVVVPAPGKQWPVVATGINTVRVSYTAGYGTDAASVPAPIRHWLLLALGDLYQGRVRSGEKAMLPQSFADGLIDSYKVWSL